MGLMVFLASRVALDGDGADRVGIDRQGPKGGQALAVRDVGADVAKIAMAGSFTSSNQLSAPISHRMYACIPGEFDPASFWNLLEVASMGFSTDKALQAMKPVMQSLDAAHTHQGTVMSGLSNDANMMVPLGGIVR